MENNYNPTDLELEKMIALERGLKMYVCDECGDKVFANKIMQTFCSNCGGRVFKEVKQDLSEAQMIAIRESTKFKESLEKHLDNGYANGNKRPELL